MDRDAWSIVFYHEQECWLVTQQLKSLIHFNNTLEYNLVINEDRRGIKRTVALLKKYGFYDLAKKSKFPINIYTREDLIGLHHYLGCGYIDQQLIKLRVYKKSKYKESIILDGKLIAVKENPLDDIQPARHSLPYSFYGWWEYCLRKWHKSSFKTKDFKQPRLVRVPYIFKNDILKALENDFEDEAAYFDFLKQDRFPKYSYFRSILKNSSWEHPGYLSEFMIYNLFEQYYDENYVEEYPNPTSLCFVKKGDEVPLENEPFISLHRQLVKELGFDRAEALVKKYTGME